MAQTLIMPNQSVALQAFAVLQNQTPGYTALNDHLTFLAAKGIPTYTATLNNIFLNQTNAQLATLMLANLGLTGLISQGDAEAYLAANSANRVGAMVNLGNMLLNYAGSDASIKAAQATYTTSLNNSYAYSIVPTNTAPTTFTPQADSTFTLTSGTDIATANVFTSGLVYNPGGTDRINALQDEDTLTGIGTNPTLNATLGNANDNGATIITPKLVGINTLNVAFTGSSAVAPGAVTALDLQDATGLNSVNITRISQAVNQAELGNIKQVVSAMSIASSNANNAGTAEISFANGVLADVNTGTLTLKDVQLGTVNVGQNDSIANFGVSTRGYENLTIVSTGAANTVGNFNLPMDTGTAGAITITGDTNLNISTTANILTAVGSTLVEAVTHGGGILQNAGRLASIDASGLQAALTLNIQAGLLSTGKADTSGVAQNVTITGSKFADTFYLSDTVQAGDVINGNDGNDTLVVYTGGVTTGTISKIETVDVQMNGNVTLDLDKMVDTAILNIRNIGNNGAIAANVGDKTVTLNNLTAVQAAALTVQHSTTTNDGITNTTIQANLKSSTNAADLVGVEIKEGVNIDPRFNFTLNTNVDVPTTATVERVESITITDSDSESNSVELTGYATHTGTVTLKGGVAGTFLNLDVDAAAVAGALAGVKGYDTTGAAVDGTGSYDVGALATEVRLVAGVIDAAQEASNVVVRVSTTTANTNGGQLITMGSGNDTVVFDDIAAGSITRANAGLTNADTVVGGAGNNTLVIDGNGVNVVLQQSEWDHVSGFQTVYLAGNGAGNQYFLQIDNDMIAANGTNGNMITIDNDNDSGVSTVTNVDARIENTAVRLDATTLSAAMHFTYDGEEGNGATADRFVVNDQNTNGGNIIDGGDVNVIVGVDAAGVTRQLTGVRSADVLEVRNTATVTTADLTNVSNVGTIVINNDQAVLQTLNLTLNTAVADAMSDAGHTASLTEVETLVITANDAAMADAAGTPLAVAAASRIVLDGRGLSGAFSLDVNGDGFGAGAADVVQMTVNLGGATSTFDLNAGADSLQFWGTSNSVVVRDSTAVGAIATQDEILFSDATATATQIQRVTGTETIDFSNTTITNNTVTVLALDGASDITTIIGNATTGTTINAAAAAKALTLTGGALNDIITGSALGDTITGAAGDDNLTGAAGNDNLTGGVGADSLTGGIGADTFVFAAGASGQTVATADVIADYSGVTGTQNDIIDFATALTIGDQGTAAAAGVATVSAVGVATFNVADTTFAQHAAAVAAAIVTAGVTVAGESVAWQEGANAYLFISDTVNGVSANDVVIQLTGVTLTATGVVIAGGNITDVA